MFGLLLCGILLRLVVVVITWWFGVGFVICLFCGLCLLAGLFALFAVIARLLAVLCGYLFMFGFVCFDVCCLAF